MLKETQDNMIDNPHLTIFSKKKKFNQFNSNLQFKDESNMLKETQDNMIDNPHLTIFSKKKKFNP